MDIATALVSGITGAVGGAGTILLLSKKLLTDPLKDLMEEKTRRVEDVMEEKLQSARDLSALAHEGIVKNIGRVEEEVREFRKEYREGMSKINETLSIMQVSVARMEGKEANEDSAN